MCYKFIQAIYLSLRMVFRSQCRKKFPRFQTLVKSLDKKQAWRSKNISRRQCTLGLTVSTCEVNYSVTVSNRIRKAFWNLYNTITRKYEVKLILELYQRFLLVLSIVLKSFTRNPFECICDVCWGDNLRLIVCHIIMCGDFTLYKKASN